MTDIELLLRSLDYDVLFRTDGWVECLVAGNGERWMGRGIDQASALRDVERQMFPSHAARAARLGSGTFLSGVSAPVLVAEGSPEPPPPDMPEETSDEAAPVEMAPVEMASPTETSPPEVVMETLPPEVVTAKLIDPDPAWSGTYVSPDGQPAQADEGAEPDMTKEEALEIVAGISDEITERDLPEPPRTVPMHVGAPSATGTLESARRDFERAFITARLREHDWNISRAAESVGIARESLSRKIKNLKIEDDRG